MSTIDENSNVFTLINVFTVEPEKQQKQLALTRGSKASICEVRRLAIIMYGDVSLMLLRP